MVGHSWAFGIFVVDVPIREEPKRATSAANGLVGAGEVHPFLHRAIGDFWRVLFDRWAVSGRLHGVRLDHGCAFPTDRRLCLCRRNGRALQDIFLMSTTTRQVTHVL